MTEIIRLNVGGVLYSTTQATLVRFPNSMLGAMFSDGMPKKLDENGCYFIDRNGRLFEYVLDFLRSSQLALPSDFRNLDALSVEADFYQIEALIECINKLKVTTVKGRFIEVIEVRTGNNATMPTGNSRSKTIVSSRRDSIVDLPDHFFASGYKPQLKLGVDEQDFVQFELLGSNVRLRLAEYLRNNGWELMNSEMSSSSCPEKCVFNFVLTSIEHSFRDRWFRPA